MVKFCFSAESKSASLKKAASFHFLLWERAPTKDLVEARSNTSKHTSSSHGSERFSIRKHFSMFCLLQKMIRMFSGPPERFSFSCLKLFLGDTSTFFVSLSLKTFWAVWFWTFSLLWGDNFKLTAEKQMHMFYL